MAILWDLLQDVEVWVYDISPKVLDAFMSILAVFTLGSVGLAALVTPFFYIAALWKILVTDGIAVVLGILVVTLIACMVCFLVVRK